MAELSGRFLWGTLILCVVVLAGCAGAGEPSAASTETAAPAVAAAEASTPPTSPTPTPTPTPVPVPAATPAVEPTTAPDPFVIPDDPDDITIEYMQAVADVFAHNDGEIIREAVEHGEFTDRMMELWNRAYGEELRDRSVMEFQELFSSGDARKRYADTPEDPKWDVSEVWVDYPGCVGIRIQRDITGTARSVEAEVDATYLVFRRRSEAWEWNPWRLERVFAWPGTELTENPCHV